MDNLTQGRPSLAWLLCFTLSSFSYYFPQNSHLELTETHQTIKILSILSAFVKKFLLEANKGDISFSSQFYTA
jgi:hypothetical protein